MHVLQIIITVEQVNKFSAKKKKKMRKHNKLKTNAHISKVQRRQLQKKLLAIHDNGMPYILQSAFRL